MRLLPQRDYDAPFTSIPPHGRYQHFSVGGRDRIANLLSTFSDSIDATEKCRRLIDLFLVSVLLDAGAGTNWSYKSTENGRVYRRSEGLAIASLEMFKSVRCAVPPSLPRLASPAFPYSVVSDQTGELTTYPRASSPETPATSSRSIRMACDN